MEALTVDVEPHMPAGPISASNAKRVPEGADSGDVVVTSNVDKVLVTDITIGDSPRLAGIDDCHVARLAECGAVLPPIVVHRQTMCVIDGMHRLHAAVRTGRGLMDVIYFDGSEGEAFVLAVELNTKHGLPLSLRDRRMAAQRILSTGIDLSDRAIASKTGLSDKTIAAIRQRLGTELPDRKRRRGRDGRSYPVGGDSGQQRAAQLIAERPRASLREIASAVGISPATVRDVRMRLSAGEDLSRSSGSLAEPLGQGMRSMASVAGPAQETRRTSGTLNQLEDKQEALERLRSDPSVRGKEAGRQLLRWLSRHAIGVGDLPEYLDIIPLHRVSLVAAIARETAGAWLEFAQTLEAIQGQAIARDR